MLTPCSLFLIERLCRHLTHCKMQPHMNQLRKHKLHNLKRLKLNTRGYAFSIISLLSLLRKKINNHVKKICSFFESFYFIILEYYHLTSYCTSENLYIACLSLEDSLECNGWYNSKSDHHV